MRTKTEKNIRNGKLNFDIHNDKIDLNSLSALTAVFPVTLNFLPESRHRKMAVRETKTYTAGSPCIWIGVG